MTNSQNRAGFEVITRDTSDSLEKKILQYCG